MLKQLKKVFNKSIIATIAIVIMVFAILFVVEILREEEEVVQAATEIPRVVVTSTQLSDISQYYEATGRMNDHLTKVGYDHVQGKVNEVYVSKGDYVEVGTTLFTMDQTSNLASLRLEANGQQESMNQLTEVIARLTVKKDEIAKLYEEGLTPRSDLRDIENQLKQYEDQKASAQNQKDAINSMINAIEYDGRVLSPVSGYVKEIKITKGALMGQESYIEIQKEEKTTCTIYLSESMMHKIQIGDEIKVQLYGSEKNYIGTIKKIKGITEEEVLFPVEIEMICDDQVLCGASVTAYIPTYEHKNAITVPRKSVISFNDQTYLYTVNEDGETKKCLVEKGESIGDYVEILSGISSKDKVIVQGQFRISDGEKVEVIQ